MTCPRNTNRPGTWDPNYLNFGPRVGLAYTLKNNTGSGLINLLFLGTRQQIDDAFQAGGWSAAERKSPLSLSMYNALTRRIGTVRLNQHHWLAQRMQEEKIGFQQCSNGFLKCSVPRKL